MGDDNVFDTEMTSLMNGEIPNSPAPTQDSTPAVSGTPNATQPSSTPKSWKAGGREWTNPDDLAKSHDSLWREFGKRNQDWKELSDLREVKKQLSNDPEFAKSFKAYLEAYQNTRKPVAPTTPNAMSLPPEVMAEINRAKDAANLLELERETQGLVRKYKLSDDDVRKVEDYSMANGGIPLEQAYKQLMFDVNQDRLARAREAEAQKKKDASKTAGPVPGHYQPSPRGGPSMKSDADWRKVAGSELSKFFKSDES